jgi:hypothetical protein
VAVIAGDVTQEVSSLKRQAGGDILINGSATLRDSSKTTPLRLVQATPVGPDGVVVLTYEP